MATTAAAAASGTSHDRQRRPWGDSCGEESGQPCAGLSPPIVCTGINVCTCCHGWAANEGFRPVKQVFWVTRSRVYFSVIQRRFLTPDDFEDLDEPAAQILAFENHCNAIAWPFSWRFTRTEPQPAPGLHPQARPVLAAANGRVIPTNYGSDH
jgi:hypothetical protein